MKTCPTHDPKHMDQTTGRCTACAAQHAELRVGRFHLRRGDKPLPYNHDADVTMKVRVGHRKEAADFLRNVCGDEIRAGQLRLMVERPPGVAKERFGVAVRAAARQPMLNANPASIRHGLDANHASREQRQKGVKKAGIAARLVIKPKTMANAKYGRNSAFWGERLWTVFTLRYSRGYVVQTDIGDDSRVFNTMGEVNAAIKASGWEIVR